MEAKEGRKKKEKMAQNSSLEIIENIQIVFKINVHTLLIQ